MDIIQALAEELKIRRGQAEAAVKLIDEGNTIPFIARYRKEATGSLNDEVLRSLGERLRYLRNLEERKNQVMEVIKEQGAMTQELQAKLMDAGTLVEVEDLYRPYKPKRRTRAMIAKERGLEPLADILALQQLKRPAIEEAAAYIAPDQGVADAKEALAGAGDILAERISDDASCRSYIRAQALKKGSLVSRAKEPGEQSVYEMYYDYEEPVKKAAGHRILALNRGEKEKLLSVHVEAPREELLRYLEQRIVTRENPNTSGFLRAVAEDSLDRLIWPSVEREVRSGLTEMAEEGAIRVFGENLKQLLMQPPVSGHVVLGWDPAFRTGCKLAVVDATGKVLDTTVIYPTAPQNKVEEAKRVVKGLIKKYGITLIAVGNGTASRESEQVIAELLREIKEPVRYVIVNEAGASVYSASKTGAEEFPDYDVAQRSAVSIARRLQDPLAELVKIEPAAIGVGQYQHDMDQKRLDETLKGVVEDCVNRVGVELNTASASLLSYVSGITRTTAKNIVSWREENGPFQNRRQLLKVKGLGPKAYEQCAGFLRITGGSEPLDGTGVHPESYGAADCLLKDLGVDKGQLSRGGIPGISRKVKDSEGTAKKLGIGAITLRDILSELEKPARDPRSEAPGPILRTDVMDIEDLRPGMVLKGTVRNVIDFGAFVDIGVHQDGLVHISQISDRYIRHPLEAVHVGDIVDVEVMSVDAARKRIQLTMRIGKKEEAHGKR